ncbi:ribonuclease R [Snodgrassella communis]|uniref:Ribonuclease R n=1 Tax=Snodgrassella communis TaxID=2946699 RepID=A0A836Z367_9NEIS|nr:ribonuclease R [Snodgrassella communis]KDN14677.1 3'-to-5' exoribonuclease RNase R [Snodgrassella communis]PIT07598.1 ribonuclease R [Snodgrassella communis]PIT27997.1 ribonuclease R [Snodgrassella communis]PIT30090.1 ribonuclease R [Snodgrassella communis]PIT37272.1 ribonuclease R [Snodgrassella communis]
MKKKSDLRHQDPYLQRELQRYSNPLPSREWIIAVLEKIGIPVRMAELAQKLNITKEETVFFERRLNAMARDGQILINRRGAVCVANKLALVKCRVEVHKDDFGFAVPLNPANGSDFVLYTRQMRGLMNGDIVTVRPAGTDRRGRREGQVLDVIERANQDVVGRLAIEHGVAMLVPEDKRLGASIVLQPDSLGKAKTGQVLVARIESYPNATQAAVARVTEVLGDYADSGMEIEIAVRKHHLPYQFSRECLAQAAKIPDHVTAAERKSRVDLRELPLITIDGETARDFDDAVYAEKIGRNYRLVVAIADVSHYVHPDDAIDHDALERATSVYFPRRVIPMLPENLSNGICSLNPNVERLCLVCDMVITYAGNIKSYEFYPAIMRSHARLTYTQAWDWISNDQFDDPMKTHVLSLYRLYQILLKKRLQRGAVEFESIETQMIFNQQGKIERIVPVERNEAHRLIEECMLAANVCAAEFLKQHKHPALYRNHAGPTSERLSTLREQLALLSLQLNGGNNPTPKDYADLSENIKERSDRSVISVMLLRSMQQAVYEPQNIGHFGLAYSAYTHFTSPIRRYPDLTVHRAIKAILQHRQYQPKSWTELGVHCSLAERKADNASRDVENWLKTYYMQDKIGEVFSGTISGMANFGLFVTLDNVYIDGMIHISDLGEDYFNFHPELMAIVGERSGIRFKLGDKVMVKVARADLDTSRIDLVLISSSSGKRSQGNNTQKVQKQFKAAVKKPRKAVHNKQKDSRTKPATGQKVHVKNTRSRSGRKRS